jgi:hypothetical protein
MRSDDSDVDSFCGFDGRSGGHYAAQTPGENGEVLEKLSSVFGA